MKLLGYKEGFYEANNGDKHLGVNCYFEVPLKAGEGVCTVRVFISDKKISDPIEVGENYNVVRDPLSGRIEELCLA